MEFLEMKKPTRSNKKTDGFPLPPCALLLGWEALCKLEKARVMLQVWFGNLLHIDSMYR